MSADLERLQQVLLPAPVTTPFIAEDGMDSELPADALIPAAVLFPIVSRVEGDTVLFTQRSAHLKDHPGQISFPGGRVEAHDASPLETALRETEEEIGLARNHVSVLGYLPEYRTGTGFRVTPVVARVAAPFELRLDPFEVAEVFEVPLAFLLDVANHHTHVLHYRGALRNFYAMPYGDYFIWGATAGMIRSLSDRLEQTS